MSDKDRDLRIAIVGLGPRGLGAIEALIVAMAGSGITTQIDGFDPIKWAGAGPNFLPEQTSQCLLNIPTREVDIAPAPVLKLSIGDFEDWLANPAARDGFPTRARLGEYLTERFVQLVNSRPEGFVINRRTARIIDLDAGDDGIFLTSEAERFGPYDEVLLTLGQPETKTDDQMSRWMSHVAKSEAEVRPAYPDRKLLESARDWAGRTVAIRGLGLSTMDVLRILTIGLGGSFKAGHYIRSGQEPARILPFSLDGQPPVPKPANEDMDRKFDITPAETDAFAAALGTAIKCAPSRTLDVICSGFVGPATRILQATNGQANVKAVKDWLATELENPGAQETRPPVDALRANIAIASGETAPDVGYVIGQIWRKLQDVLRRGFNPRAIGTDTAAAIIGFDEGLKRYSYGPPLRSAQELVMLIEADLVSLLVADDPDIELVAGGWRFSDSGVELDSSVIVDAVIPPVTLESLTEPLFLKLEEKGFISAFADGLGLRTESDGRLIGPQGKASTRPSLLGRMAIGSVIAADSIHDCFGASAKRWANGVRSRCPG